MFTVKVISDVSKKTGKPYTALVIQFPNGYEKFVFLKSAEIFMLSPAVPAAPVDETSF